MNENFSFKNNSLFYLSLIIITVITFFPFFSTGFGNADDVHNYLVAQKGEFAHNAGYLAQMSGRFYYYLVYWVMGLPWLSENVFITKLFLLVPVILGILLFAKILFGITKSREISFLYYLLFLIIAQISGYTSLILTYPLYFTFSFDLLLVSFILLLKYFDNRKTWILILSSLLFLTGLLFYETYLVYALVIAITIIIYDLKQEGMTINGFKKSSLHFLPYFLVTILYLAVYFIFRVYHPSKYDGSSFASVGITASLFFKSLWSLSYTSFPLTVWETSRDFFTTRSELINGFRPVVLDVILNARVEWIIKGILVSWIGYQLLCRMPKVKHLFLLAGSLIAILLIFMPQIPLALTPKYTFYVKYGMIGYIPTYYSLFGSVLLLSILTGYLAGLANSFKFLKHAIAGLFFIGFFVCSVMTDFSNYAVAKDVRSANLRFYAMSDLIKSEKFRIIPGGTTIFAKDLYNNPSHSAGNLTEQFFNWSDFIGLKTGIYHNIYREEKDFTGLLNDTVHPLYYFTMQQAVKTEDLLLAIGKLNQPLPGDTLHKKLTNRALVSYYSPYKIFTVSFSFRDEATFPDAVFRINHIHGKIPPGKEVHLTIYNTHMSDLSTIFTIEMESIDMNSITITNLVNPLNEIFYL